MANKKKATNRDNVGNDVPLTLKSHSFYGLELDEEQKELRDAIWNPDIDFIAVNAAAGTGKTLISLATANLLVQYHRYEKIIYMMAGTQMEKLGYLPGSFGEKMAPYFMPLYDAASTLGLNYMTDINACTDEWESPGDGFIDCMSHNFLRGRNIEPNTVLLIDEAQNFYIDEMKTILTRVLDGAKVIMIGHSGQCDLYKHPERSGFVPYLKHFADQERCKVLTLSNNHRGWISQWADKLQ